LRRATLPYPLPLSLNAPDSLNYLAQKAAIAGTLLRPNPKGESVMATDWPGYVGMATGIFGALMGFLGYRRSNHIKTLELRLELRKDLGEAHESLSTLRTVIESAASSRPRVLAMKGLGRSGNMVAWSQTVETDRAEVERLAALLRDDAADFTTLSSEQLASEIVSAHKLKASLSTLVDKYRGELAADDEARRQRHHEVITMTAAQMHPSNRPVRA
jgi:hypothetical protein